MNTVHSHPLITDYLRHLDDAARELPPAQRADLTAEIREHIEAAVPDDADEAGVRNALDRLGPPEEIVAVARPTGASWQPAPEATVSRMGGVEIAAIITLAIGGLILSVFGLPVGLVLAWVSSLWTRRDKLIATALTVAPFLIVVAIGLASGLTTQPPDNPDFVLLPDTVELVWGAGLLATLVSGPAAAVYLGLKVRRRVRDEPPRV